MSGAVCIDQLSFTYRNALRPALAEVSGVIEGGGFVVIMGHGGAGKSSLCGALNGLIPHFFRGDYGGRVIVSGTEIRKSSVAAMARLVGLVFQDFEAQLFSSSVELEMAFGPENFRISHDDMERRIVQYLDFVGLLPMRKRDTATLSGGEKQRLGIAAVLAGEPEVLLMDEPMTDLDPEGRRSVLSLAAALKNHDRTLIMVDNVPEQAMDADRIWVMREGHLAAEGTPQKILTDLPLLQSCGVGIPPIAALFGAMGWPGCPLSPEEALRLIDRYHLLPRHDIPRFVGSARSCVSPVLSAQGISHRYPDSETMALKDVHLDIGDGEFVAILGRNGSGKTTLAKHFNGLLNPTSGRMLIGGRPTTSCRRHELARQIGYVFQNPDHQIFASTVREEVGFGPRVLGEDRQTIERNVAEALEATGLAGYEDRVPFLLTRGERQRVAVASVLAVKPRVIILDEPTTGLDSQCEHDTMEMLKTLHRKGHTVVMVTHSMPLAETYADRIILMKDGRVIADGDTRGIFANENLLAEASLSPSALARLSNRLGLATLSLEGMVREIKGTRPPS